MKAGLPWCKFEQFSQTPRLASCTQRTWKARWIVFSPNLCSWTAILAGCTIHTDETRGQATTVDHDPALGTSVGETRRMAVVLSSFQVAESISSASASRRAYNIHQEHTVLFSHFTCTGQHYKQECHWYSNSPGTMYVLESFTVICGLNCSWGGIIPLFKR